MKQYEVGETAVAYLEIKEDNAYHDPETSVKIVIYSPSGAVDTASTDMTKETTGKYSYDYQTSGKTPGIYKAVCTATDSTKITSTSGKFQIVPLA